MASKLENPTNIVLAAFPTAVVYGCLNAFLEKHLYRPVGFSLAGLRDVGMDSPVVLREKFQAWASSLVVHSGMWLMWWNFAKNNDCLKWVFDHKRWGDSLNPLPDNHPERSSVGVCYVVYFSYVLHTCYRDMLASGRKGGRLQMIFHLHHLIAIFLVSLSIKYGAWRGGVMTRLIHDVGDIALYAAKLRQALYETRREHPSVLTKWFAFSLITFASTRIGLYGYLCRSFDKVLDNVRTKKDPNERVHTLLNYGSWLMFVLQIVFVKGFADTMIGYYRSGGEVVDVFHGTSVQGTGKKA